MTPTVGLKSRVLIRIVKIRVIYSAPAVRMPFVSLSITTVSALVIPTLLVIRKYCAKEYYLHLSAQLTPNVLSNISVKTNDVFVSELCFDFKFN